MKTFENKIKQALKNPISITGDAEMDASLNTLLYSGDIENFRQGFYIADTFGLSWQVIDNIATVLLNPISQKYHNITTKEKELVLEFLKIQNAYKPLTVWKDFTYLSFQNFGLDSLPDSIGNLKNLKKIYLRDNNLTYLPDSIGNLKQLKGLFLQNNNLTYLPDFIGNLKNLVSLDLSTNNLTKLPKSIGNLKNLDWLELNENPIKDINKIQKLLPNAYIRF